MPFSRLVALPLLATAVLLQACATAATNGAKRSDCDRAGARTLQRLAAVPAQAGRMREIADGDPVAEKSVSPQQKYERWYRLDNRYTRLCRDDHGMGVETWDFAVAGNDVQLVDKTLLLSLSTAQDPRTSRGNVQRSFRPRAGGRIVF